MEATGGVWNVFIRVLFLLFLEKFASSYDFLLLLTYIRIHILNYSLSLYSLFLISTNPLANNTTY